MKHIQTFESYSKKEIDEDNKIYKKFLSMTKDEISEMSKEYRELKSEAIKACNKALNDEGHKGSLGASDVSDDQVAEYLDKDKKEKFLEYSRILDFKDGFKTKK